MLARARLPGLLLLPRLRSASPGLAAMSSATGTITVQQPLNYRAGARVQPADGGQLEEVFEPATGTGELRGQGELGACRARCARLSLSSPGCRLCGCPAAPEPPLLEWPSSASALGRHRSVCRNQLLLCHCCSLNLNSSVILSLELSVCSVQQNRF